MINFSQFSILLTQSTAKALKKDTQRYYLIISTQMDKLHAAKPGFESPTSSRASSTISLPPTNLDCLPDLLPNASTVLTINAQGMKNGGIWSNKELSTSVYRNAYSSGEPAYVSTRPVASSNSAVLQRTDGRGDAIVTTYKAGFGEPKIGRLSLGEAAGLAQDKKLEYGLGRTVVEVKTKWYSTAATLKLDDGRALEWKYVKTQVQSAEGRKKKKRVVALSTKNHDREEVLAVLLRTKETRTTGTGRWDAGNGGQLFLGHGAEHVLEEGVIVATCLMMLKREIDNSSAATVAAIS